MGSLKLSILPICPRRLASSYMVTYFINCRSKPLGHIALPIIWYNHEIEICNNFNGPLVKIVTKRRQVQFDVEISVCFAMNCLKSPLT